MSGLLPYLLALAATGLLLAAIRGIRLVGERQGWSAEVQRKCVHVMVGLFAMFLPAIFPSRWPVVVLVVLAIIVMLLMRRRTGVLAGAGAAIHSVERKGFGDVWLAAAIGFLFLQSDGDYLLYGLPLAIITLSDAAAALTGSAYGRKRFVTEGGVKSWEGVIAFTMVGWVTAMSMLLLFSDAERGNVILLGLVIAVFGAMVEAVSWRGLDNLFVPLAIYFFLLGFVDSEPLTLALVALGFFAGTALAQGCAGRVGLAPQTARAFGVALFIFIGAGSLVGTILPLLAMAAYLLSRRLIPGIGKHPDLDFLGTLCSAAAIWLFIGETAGLNAFHYYNAAMAGIVLVYGLAGLRAAHRLVWSGILTVALLAVVGALTFSGLHFAPPPQHPILMIGISFALIWLAAIFAAPAFHRWRAPRSAALASLVPLTFYALEASLS